MTFLVFTLDILVFGSASAAAWFWFKASRNRLRRVSKHEIFDAADLNRIIVAMNRAQILNARAALTTACAATLAFVRLLSDVNSMSLI